MFFIIFLSFLKADSLGKIGRLNRAFYFITADETLWKRHCIDSVNESSGLKFIQSLEEDYQKKKKEDLSLLFFWKKTFIEIFVAKSGTGWLPSRQLPSYKELVQYLPNLKISQDLRIVIVGSGGVGKSASVIQFVQHVFVEEYDPTIEDSYRKMVELNHEVDYSVLVDILDTAGPEEYSAMRDQYMRAGEGFIIMYDVTRRSSFDEVTVFRDQVLRVKDADPIPIIIVGNKIDLTEQREVSTGEGIALAKMCSCPFYEISAKQNIGVQDVFLQLIWECAICKYLHGRLPQQKQKKCIVM